MNKILFIAGLCLALAAAALLFLDIIESGVAALIGFIGIGLIAVSGSPKPRC
jgi:small-conductance mechanosensitive channel